MTGEILHIRRLFFQPLLHNIIFFIQIILLTGTVLLSANSVSCAVFYSESPELKALVENDMLPPITERLPIVPMVIKPVAQVGQYGGTWRRGMLGTRDHANFIRTIGYENLMRWNEQWTHLMPNVALSVSVNEQATEYLFTLRQGMKWSDGAPFTADDILFWYEDVYCNEAFNTVDLKWLVGDRAKFSVEKLDEYQVVFRFAAPNGLFLQQLANPKASAPTSFPKHYLKQFHKKYNPQIKRLVEKEQVQDWVELFEKKFGKVTNAGIDHPSRWSNPDLPTLNAWILKNGYSETATQFVAHRNPFYWKVDMDGNQLPYLDHVLFSVAKDSKELLDWATGGQIDMQSRHLGTIQNRSRLQSHSKTGQYHFFYTLPSNGNFMAISLNLNHLDPAIRELFQNKQFRIALSHAIDRKTIIESALNGNGQPYQVAPLPQSPHYLEKLAKQYTEYNPRLANQILDEAGFTKGPNGSRLTKDGVPIAFTIEVADALYPEWQLTTKMISRNWNDLGISVAVKIESRELFFKRKSDSQHDACVWIAPGGLDVIQSPRYYLPFTSEGSDYAVNWAKWHENPLDPQAEKPPDYVLQQFRYFDELGTKTTTEEQNRVMGEILQIATEQFYTIGVATLQEGYGIVKTNFRNVPALMPESWIYPNPAPTNPCQYYIEKQ